MIDPSIITIEINNLEKIAEKIEIDFKKLLEDITARGTGLSSNNYSLGFFNPSGDLWDLQRDELKKYEQWYSMALLFVHQYVPEKENEFAFYYDKTRNEDLSIKDLIQFKRPQFEYFTGADEQQAVVKCKKWILQPTVGSKNQTSLILSGT